MTTKRKRAVSPRTAIAQLRQVLGGAALVILHVGPDSSWPEKAKRDRAKKAIEIIDEYRAMRVRWPSRPRTRGPRGKR